MRTLLNIRERSSAFFSLALGVLLILTPILGYGQSAHIINGGAKIHTSSGVTVRTSGEVVNEVNGANIGEIHNFGNIVTEHPTPSNAGFTNLHPQAIVRGNGTFEIEGDWTNNGEFFGDTGLVILDGPDQLITGDSLSPFNDLSLTGAGTKTQTLDAEVWGVLDLTDRRLHTDTNTMFVMNPVPGAITRLGGNSNSVQGFVSSDSSGWLYREMDQSSAYLFPVGDSLPSPRYRPYEVTPSTTNNHAYKVDLVNLDPTNDGYDVTTTQAGVGNVNSSFYWRAQRPSGSDPADISMYYDAAVDTGQLGVHWNSQWNMMGSPTVTANASPTLSYVTEAGWNSFSPDPFNIASNPIQVDAGLNDTICPGDSVQLNATTTGGSGPYGYTWTPSTYLNDTTIQNPQAQGVMDTITYYVVAYDSSSGSYSSQDSVTIIVRPEPNVTVSPSNPAVCPGDSVELVASGANSFVWSPSSYLNTTTGDTVVSTPSSDTTYTVLGTDSFGCVGTTTVSVSVDSVPTAPTVTSTPDTICQGDSAVINASGSGSNVVYEVYDSASGGNYLGNTSLAVYPMTDSTFYVEATLQGGGCSYPGGRDSVTINVQPAPSPPTSITLTNDTICAGDSTTIDASGSGPGVNYEVYDSASGGSLVGTTPLVVTPTSTTTYYVQAVNSNGCDQLATRDSITVEVVPLPNVNAGADTVICPQDTIQLTATGGMGHVWSTGDSASTISVHPDSNTTYYVTGSNSFGCSNVDSVLVTIYSVAPIQANDDSAMVVAGQSVDIPAFSNDMGNITDSSIVWGPYQGNSSLIIGGLSYDAPSEPGMDSLGYRICDLVCASNCDTATVWITIEEGIPDLFIPNGVSANGDGYNDKFVISGLQAYPENSLRIFNRWGEEIYYAEPYENDWAGDVNEGFVGSGGTVPSGTYFYILDLGPDEDLRKGYIEFRQE